MIKEEKELRYFIRGKVFGPGLDDNNLREAKRLITAFREAVYEDAAKKCDAQAAFYRSLKEKGPGGMVDADIARAIAAEDCAALIRGRRGNE